VDERVLLVEGGYVMKRLAARSISLTLLALTTGPLTS
jgi:hypothetical protein